MKFRAGDGISGERDSTRSAACDRPSALASVDVEACEYCVLLVRGIQQRRVFLCGEDSTEARARLRDAVEKIPAVADSARDWFGFFSEATRLFADAGFIRVAH